MYEKLVLIGDDADLHNLLQHNLNNEGFQVVGYELIVLGHAKAWPESHGRNPAVMNHYRNSGTEPHQQANGDAISPVSVFHTLVDSACALTQDLTAS